MSYLPSTYLRTFFVISSLFLCATAQALFEEQISPHVSVKAKAFLPSQDEALDKWPLNKLFRMELKIEGKDAEKWSLKDFDIQMPAHKHGMLVKAKIEAAKTKGEAIRIEGLKMHMPGDWQVIVTLEGPDGLKRLKKDIQVK